MSIEQVKLGRTGIEASAAGLGCGGFSRLGLSRGGTDADAIRVVHRALEQGVTVIDTAQVYETEWVVGRAIDGRRADVVLSTKISPQTEDGRFLTAKELRNRLHTSLEALGTEWVDVLFLHGVLPEAYDHCRGELLPELLSLKRGGSIRAIGVSERFPRDPGHEMMRRAAADGSWDVLMVGFNILNQSARTRVLSVARDNDLGVMVMFAVRHALAQTENLRRTVSALVAEGRVSPEEIDENDPLEFLLHDRGALSVVDAAYRFCRHEPGCHVTLTGTGSLEHLEANLESLARPPLPRADVERLGRIFRSVDHVSGGELLDP
jgi:aryl-alcohol dehydrogenase-like predicted oxidoreductase